MRAQFIFEKINFERTGNPVRQMDIGKNHLEKERIRSLNWGIREDFLESILSQDYGFEEYMGFDILIYPIIFDSGKIQWFAITNKFEAPSNFTRSGRGFKSIFSSTGKAAESKESASKDVKAKIRKKLRDES